MKQKSRKSLSLLLTLSMLLGMVPAFGGTASASYHDALNAGETELNENDFEPGDELESGTYYLSADASFDNSESGNGLKIASGATVYIYLNGHTLTAIGKNGDGGADGEKGDDGDASINVGNVSVTEVSSSRSSKATASSGANGGYAGIYLPSNSTLIFVGSGTVSAQGGNPGKGGNGGKGGDGYAQVGTGDNFADGGGGGGGGGAGAGGGAGIGTNGVGTNEGGGGAAGALRLYGAVTLSLNSASVSAANGSTGEQGAAKETDAANDSGISEVGAAGGGGGGSGGGAGGLGAGYGSGGGIGIAGMSGGNGESAVSRDGDNLTYSGGGTLGSVISGFAGTPQTPVEWVLKSLTATPEAATAAKGSEIDMTKWTVQAIFAASDYTLPTEAVENYDPAGDNNVHIEILPISAYTVDGAAPTTETLTAAKTYEVAFGAETCEVTISLPPHSLTAAQSECGEAVFSVTVNNNSYPVSAAAEDTVVTLTVTPEQGYTVDSLSLKAADNTDVPFTGTAPTYTFTMPDDDVTATVSYLESKYAITAPTASNGTYTVQVAGDDVTEAAPGKTVDVTVTPDSGYVFEGLTVTKTGEAATVVDDFETGFVMPGYPVTIDVSIAAEPSAEEKLAWHELNATDYPAGSTLCTGRYYLTADAAFDGSGEGNGLKLASGAIVYIYLNGHTLSAAGKAASGMTAGFAGIYVPADATLYLVGDGAVSAVGGAAAVGGNGTNGGDGYASASCSDSAVGSLLGGASVYATGGKGGSGGNGGGGAGAGIGTNGVNGVTASTGQSVNANTDEPEEAGTVILLGEVDVAGTTGGKQAYNGEDGKNGKPASDSDYSYVFPLSESRCSAAAGGGAGGSGGQGGSAGAIIGAGGKGGSGGAKGGDGTASVDSTGSNASATDGTAAGTNELSSENTTDASVRCHLVGISANTALEDNLLGPNMTITGEKDENGYLDTDLMKTLSVDAYYSKDEGDTALDQYDADENWVAIDIDQLYVTDGGAAQDADGYIGVWLSNQTSGGAGDSAEGGNNILVTFDAGDNTGVKTVELNTVSEQTNTDFLGGDANKFHEVSTVAFVTYDGTAHAMTELFDFAAGGSRSYAALYTPYNSFVDYSAQGKDVGKYASFVMDDPTVEGDESRKNPDNWLLGGNTAEDAEIEAFFDTPVNRYFDASRESGNYQDVTGGGAGADFANMKVKNAGLYTVYERLLDWVYTEEGTYAESFDYNSYYVLIEKANLNISNAIDTVTVNTTVQAHTFDRTVVGENNEDVLGEYTMASNDAQSTVYSYCRGESWADGNAQNKSANKNTPDITGLSWEYNVKRTYNAGDTWGQYDSYAEENPDGDRNQNNYLCQNDGTSLSVDAEIDGVKYTAGKTVIDGETLKADKNTWYSGNNGELHYADPDISGGIALLDASDSLNITARYEATQKLDADGVGSDSAKTAWEGEGQEYRDGSDEEEHAYVAAGETITSIFAEDVAFGASLFKESCGFRVSTGDAVSGSLSGGTPITGSAALGATQVVNRDGALGEEVSFISGDDLLAKLIDADAKTYKGDYYVVSVTDSEGKLVKTWDYNDVDDDCDIRTNIPAGSEFELIPDNGWDAFQTGEYTVTVEYVGLYYQNNIDNAGRAPDWNGTESFNWVTAGKSFRLVIEARNIAYKPMSDLYKVYDNSRLLVRDTMDANGDVARASRYIIDLYNTPDDVNQFVKGMSNAVNSDHNSYDDCMWNYLQPEDYGDYNTQLQLELAGKYAAGLADGAEEMTITASRLNATANKDEDNYTMVAVSNQQLMGEIFVAQMYPTHAMNAVVRVHETTPLCEILGLSVKAYMPVTDTASNARTDMSYDDTGYFGEDVAFALIELINKDNIKGLDGNYAADTLLTVDETTNYARAYDFDADYELLLDAKSDIFIVHGVEPGYPYAVEDGLEIDKETGEILHVATRISNNNNVNNYLSVALKLEDFGSFAVIHQEENTQEYPSAKYGECTESDTKNGARDTTVYGGCYAVKDGTLYNTSAYDSNTLTHTVRYYIGGNSNTFNVLLPINQLNTRGKNSAFDNEVGSEQDIVVGSGETQETYQYVTLYENGDRATFRFTLPQDSYLADLLLVAIPEDDSGNTPTSNTGLMPRLADVDTTTNVVGKFSEVDDTDGKISSAFSDKNCNLFLKLQAVRNDNGDDIMASDFSAANADAAYGGCALADADYQTGGSTYVFSLTTGESNLGTEFNLMIVPVIEKYGDILDDAVPAALSVEQTITDATDATLIAGADNHVYVNYKTLLDTSAYGGNGTVGDGCITMRYTAPNGSTVTRSWKLGAENRDEFHSFDIDTAATNDANGIGGGNNTAFFDHARLIPGTVVSGSVNVWRNGVNADVAATGDADLFDSAAFTWTVSAQDYSDLFSARTVTLRNLSGILGYSATTFSNFGKVPIFVTNHANSANLEDAAWSIQNNFDAVSKYNADWYTDAGFTVAVPDPSAVTSALGGTFYGKTRASTTPSGGGGGGAGGGGAAGGGGGGGGGGATAPAVTVPVSGDSSSVSVSATISGSTATVAEPTDAQLESVIGVGVDTGDVKIDLSSLGNTITTAAVPTETIRKIETAIADKSNDAESLTIQLSAGSATFDDRALSAVVDQANGAEVELKLDSVGVNTLTSAQQTALAEMEPQAAYDIYLTSNGRRVSDFKGGKATITLIHPLKGGQVDRGVVVLSVADDGAMTEVPATYSDGKVTFSVPNLSDDYVIAYDASRAAVCQRDSACPISAFTDADPREWYHDGVHWALENSVMNGIGGGLFDPTGMTNRAMLVTMLYRMEGEPSTDYNAGFTDVPEGEWFAAAVNWAAEQGITTGYGNGEAAFGPNDALSREQIITFLYRFARYKGFDVKTGGAEPLAAYGDGGAVSEWAADAVGWAVDVGIVTGDGNGMLSPLVTADRVQVATMLMRFCKQFLG